MLTQFSTRDFRLYDFIDKIKRNHTITLIEAQLGKQPLSVCINLELMSHYTDFFSEKKGLFVDNTYTIPFSIEIAIEMFDHMHALFITLQDTEERLFKLLCAFDYFCINVESVYTYIISKINYSDTLLNTWTKDALDSGSNLALKIINLLYDRRYETFSYVYTYDKDILFFLLRRKWTIKNMNMEQFYKKALLLEFYLFQSVMNYIERPNAIGEQEKEREGEFLELWKFVYPCLLSKESLLSFSNNPFARLVKDELIGFIHQKLQIFSCFPIINESRFCIEHSHLSTTSLSIGQRVQVMDRKQKWYTATITEINEADIKINFDNFSNRYDENINKSDAYRFLPVDTLSKDIICPCKQCITKIFEYKNNIINLI